MSGTSAYKLWIDYIGPPFPDYMAYVFAIPASIYNKLATTPSIIASVVYLTSVNTKNIKNIVALTIDPSILSYIGSKPTVLT
jgi:hypothetical protein